ncbi:MAG TPA: hypothetical protein PLU30_00945 [Verrucomicrobiae bacterium]|nr:hypothetical protein [Verrucomicrobiae bacterium]
MKSTTASILLVVLAVSLLRAENIKKDADHADASSNPQDPGSYKMLTTGDKQHGNAVDLFIPKAYAEKKDKRFPVLWMIGCWGCKDFNKLEAWAEKNEFILADLPKVEWNTNPAEAREMLKDAEKFLSHIRIHPSLQFILAVDRWVGQQAFFMYGNNPKAVAGLILSGVRYYTDSAEVGRHTTVVAIFGDQPDSLARPSEIRAGLDRLQKKTYNVMVHVMSGKTATAVPDVKTFQNLLDAAFIYQSVTNPGLSNKEVQENLARADKTIAGAAISESARDRLDTLTAFVKMPRLESLKFSKTLTEEWYKAFVEAFRSATAKEAFTILSDPFVDKLVRAMPASYRNEFSGPYSEMTRSEDYLAEVAAGVALRPVLEKFDEAASRNDAKKLLKAKDDLSDFIEKYSGTLAAETARSAKSSMNSNVIEPKK